MNSQQARKKFWAFCKYSDGPGPQPFLPCQRQEQLSHKRGLPCQSPVCPRVTPQVVAPHGVRERNGLPEGEAQTLAGDGIDAAGSVSNQRNVA
jgi:hypothetical protein